MKKIVKITALLFIVFLLPSCNIPGWSTYTNAAYGFQLQYPSAGSLVSDTPTAARIQLPIASGTNLAEKYLDISVVDGASPCLSPEAAGYAPGSLTPVSLVVNGLNWVRVSAGEGAAGSYYDWTGYSTASGSVCVSLTFILHSHPPGVYATPPPEFDRAGESHVFELIVDTFSWIGAGPLSTLVVTYTPTPVSSFTPTLVPTSTPTPTPVASYTPTLVPSSTPTPTPVASYTPTLVPSSTPTPTSVGLFFIPHLNAFCRRGPDPIFDSIGLAMKGQSYLIDGRDAGNTWFRIMLELNRYCWVLQSTGTASGDLSKLRVLYSPPTPTFTPIPVDCSQYKDPKSCNAVPACIWKSPVTTGRGSCTPK